jgi:hypothetical protein
MSRRERHPPHRFSPGRSPEPPRPTAAKRERPVPAPIPVGPAVPSEDTLALLNEATAPILESLKTINEEQLRQTRYLARLFKIVGDVEEVLVDIHEANAVNLNQPPTKVAKPSPPAEPEDVVVSLQASVEEIPAAPEPEPQPAAAAAPVAPSAPEPPVASALLEARLNCMTTTNQ